LLFFRYFAMIEDTPLVNDRIGTTQMGDYKLVGIGDIPQARYCADRGRSRAGAEKVYAHLLDKAG